MSDPSKPFDFASFVPGFDFLKSLASGGASGAASAMPGLPGVASWVAPTLSVEEVDKRIQELKTVQFWLDQNVTALKATIQALEVQKMTLSTLRGMNVRMEDLANAFTRTATAAPSAAAPAASAPPPPAPAPAPAPVTPSSFAAPSAERGKDEDPEQGSKKPGKAVPTAGVVDPLQWWGALTQQFEQIAGSALRDAASLKVPALLQTAADQAGDAMRKSVSAAAGAARPAAVAKKKPAAPSRKPAAKRAAVKRPAPGKR